MYAHSRNIVTNLAHVIFIISHLVSETHKVKFFVRQFFSWSKRECTMGAAASKKRVSQSKNRQSGEATDVTTLSSGGQNISKQDDKPTQVYSRSHGDTQSDIPEGTGSSKQVTPKEAVKIATVAAVINDGDAVTTETEEKAQEQSTGIGMLTTHTQWLGYREIFVQYIPGKPYALAEFGAYLYTHQDRHVFMAIDGTGLAKAVGLRNYDVLLAINNLQSQLNNAQQLAVLECFSDVGTDIGLVIQRKRRQETWLFAFHLNEKANRPVVENIFKQRIDSEGGKFSFPVIPNDAAFPIIPVYSYQDSVEVEIVLVEGDRFMEIDTDKATYVLHRQIVTLNKYQEISGGGEDGIPLSISTATNPSCGSDSDSDTELDNHDGRKDVSPLCIEAVGIGPLDVIAFPPYMTQPGSIPQNNMFFIESFQPDDTIKFTAANTQQDSELSITSNVESGNLWTATLGQQPSGFKIVSGDGRTLTSLQDLLNLFNFHDS